MSGSRYLRLGLLLVLPLWPILSATAQDCTPPQFPNASIYAPGVYSVALDPSIPPAAASAVAQAFDYWNSVLGGYNVCFMVSGSQAGTITVFIDPTLDPYDLAWGSNSNANIRINPSAVNNPEYSDDLLHLFAHEVGHVVGYDHTDYVSCQDATVMYFTLPPSGFRLSPGTVLPSDAAAASGTYNQPPPDPDGPPCVEECGDDGPESPLVLDLSGDGVSTTSLSDGVIFDIDGDGLLRLVAWTVANSDDAFLAIDMNNNRLVDDGSEMFGVGATVDGVQGYNGFIVLAQYDLPNHGGDDDGVISHRDKVFAHLLLWIDSNHDGLSSAREVIPIMSSGVIQLNLHYDNVPVMDSHGNVHLLGTYLVRDGGAIFSRPLVDVYFQSIGLN